jgi:DNA topoisomerase-1
MRLVIVESPTKAKTIKQFLGKDYIVESSFGHVRDLPQKELAIETDNHFNPKYVIIPKARKVVSLLKERAKKSQSIILATDEDREGEAIAWHLIKALDIDESKTTRIVFHEITKSAIEEALQNPRSIDLGLVDSQQARRILDRLVGYKLSPLLWRKVARGLSAGRVQSVAVRLVAERQKEIDGFKPEEYWTIIATLLKIKNRDTKIKNDFEAILTKIDNKSIGKLDIKTRVNAEEIVKDLNGLKYTISDIEKKETRRNPFPPFTTSTLQQEASRKLRFSAKQTMFIAQQLYEGITIGDGNKESIGLITYMRTDSLNLAGQAINAIINLITNDFGKEYLPIKPNIYKTRSKGAQEAHEAIRPTFPEKRPEELKQFLNKNQWSLYNLIWQRAIACQMKSAVFDSTTINIETNKSLLEHVYLFRASGNIMKFPGFLRVWPIKKEDILLPELEKKENLDLIEVGPFQHFTQPLAPYTEATLVRALEENGIGRPSTYAPILETIQKRGYVIKRIKYLYPTDIGIVVNKLLVEHFPKIVDIGFTAKMEDDLDSIANGKKKWVPVVEKFYKPFEETLKEKYNSLVKKDFIEEKSDEICEKCGAPMVIKTGRFGKFLACSKYPECKTTKPLEQPLGVKCPQCETGQIIERKTRKGKIFYSCNQWPKCKFALWYKPIDEKCPKCDSLLIETRGGNIKCSNKECEYTKD